MHCILMDHVISVAAMRSQVVRWYGLSEMTPLVALSLTLVQQPSSSRTWRNRVRHRQG